MKGKLFDFYVSKNGTDVFKYALTGTKEELAAFEASQPVVHRKEITGEPIFFSTRNGGKVIDVTMTRGTDTKPSRPIINNTTQRGVLNVINNNANNLFGQALATEYAKQQLAEMLNVAAPGATKAAVKPVVETDDDQDGLVDTETGEIVDAQANADDIQSKITE